MNPLKLKVLVRPLALSDCHGLMRLFADEDLCAACGMGHKPNLPDMAALIQKSRGGQACRERHWAIVVQSSATETSWAEIVGLCSLTEIEDRSAEISYCLAAHARGQGLMTFAAREAIRHAFETLNISVVSASVAPGNKSSLRLLARLGFIRRDGVFYKTRPPQGENLLEPLPMRAGLVPI